MIRSTLALALAALLLVACQNQKPTKRFEGDEYGFSCEVPHAWSSHPERGSLVFTSETQPKRTIVIRAVDRSTETDDGPWIAATDVVVSGLPDVQIVHKRTLTGALPGALYQLSFLPPGSTSRYTRTHVVLLGKQRLFHVIETAPAGTASDDTLLDRLVESFREEV